MNQPELQVSVPARYIKRKAVDYPAEMLALLNCRTRINARLSLPPVTLGHMTLLELLDARFVRDPGGAERWDLWLVCYVIHAGPAALEPVRDYLAAGGPRPVVSGIDLLPFELAVAEFGERHDITLFDAGRINAVLGTVAHGYETIPGAGGGNEWLFAGEMHGSAAMIAGGLAKSHHDLLWHVPLVAIGFVTAAHAAAAGAKVARPHDPADIKAKIAEARARELAGEWHPWQLEDPRWNPPTAAQLTARPAMQAEHQKMVEDAEAKS
jgi:hypothetical protein